MLTTEKMHYWDIFQVERGMVTGTQSAFCGGNFQLVGIGDDERNWFFKFWRRTHPIECEDFFGRIDSAQHVDIDDVIDFAQFLGALV